MEFFSPLKPHTLRGYGHGSTVNSTCCSYRELRFQNLQGSLQLSTASVPEDLVPPSGLSRQQAHIHHTMYIQEKHP